MAQMPDYGFVDMHCHILPQVDDGSESFEMSRKMLEVAADNNIESIILTPHNKGGHENVSPEGIDRRLKELQKEADKLAEEKAKPGDKPRGIDLYPGNEIMYDSTVLERLDAGKICTMADSVYVLVEFKPWEELTVIQGAMRELSFAGYCPILAHCERYECLTKDISLVEDLCRNGVYIQVNAGSVLPKMFAPIPKFVNEILSRQLVSFVGTDAHKDVGRAPYMMECWQYLVKKYDADYVRQIMRDNAYAVVRNYEI